MINSLVIIGRLVRDAELKKGNNDLSIATFSIAVDSGKEQAYFFDCKAFGKVAENIIKYTRKGDQVCVSGYLSQRQYETKDGQKRTAFEIVANGIEYLNQKPKEQPTNKDQEIDEQSGLVAPKQSKNIEQVAVNDDDLPF